jgi:hypothetical protein
MKADLAGDWIQSQDSECVAAKGAVKLNPKLKREMPQCKLRGCGRLPQTGR